VGFALLVALGCLGWAWFLDFGRFSFASHDWPKELDYLSTLHDAATRHLVPWRSTVAQQGTDGLLANPEVPLSPDVVLLRWIGPGAFLAVHTVIAFALTGAVTALLARELLAHFAALSLRATGQAATAPWSFSSARVSAQGPGGAYAASLALGALITIAAAVTALRLVRPGLAPSEPT
jgi:hypothetical protein